MNIYLDSTTGRRDKQLMKQSGVDVIRDEDGNITLTGSLLSITDARYILMKWKDNMSTIDGTTSSQKRSSKQRPEDLQEQTAKMNESRYADETVVVTDKSRQRTVHLEKGNLKINVEVTDELESNTTKRYINEGESDSASAMDDYVYVENRESGETIEFVKFQRMRDDFLVMTTDEGIKVYVYQGNICYLKVSSIVNSSNDQSAVISVAGHLIKEEYRRRCKEQEATQQGSRQWKAFRTSSGDLQHYNCIFNVCPTFWREGRSREVFYKELKDVLIHSLVLADDNKLKSIGLPVIGSGEL